MTEAVLTSEPLAHLGKDRQVHLLVDHLCDVGELAAQFGADFAAREWARLAGRWHDLGKYSADFQVRIRTENGFEAHLEGVSPAQRDHSTAGAIHAFATAERAGARGNGAPLAFAIAGHHAGLANRVDLLSRVEQKGERYQAALRGGAPLAILASGEGLPPLPRFVATPRTASERCDLELWIRLLFSALCDADFLDTEAFYDRSRAALRGSGSQLVELAARLAAYLDHIEHAANDSEVNRVRAEVRKACGAAATLQPGAFSLTVPTGGGKTLASLAFALAHAVQHGLHRVVVAIPFTSIIEQTADQYRAALGEGAVLEHHSALDPERETPQSRVSSENWDFPVIVTTTVQLFESLLANRPGACRKLHRLARSVIVLDEAQAIRVGSLKPVLDVLRSLVAHHGVSIVISTATQPAWNRCTSLPEGLDNVREIVPPTMRAFERLRRVRVNWPAGQTPIAWHELGRTLASESDALAIVHLRRDARGLCAAVDEAAGNLDTFHLSALMCAEHRSRVLREVKERKATGRQVRLVATQLVEAGVDLDFRVVYRALGGLDALAQAAGRCNREGRYERGDLRVFIAPTQPPRGVLQAGLAIARSMLAAAATEIDLFNPVTQRRYFEALFSAKDLDDRQIQTARAGLNFRTVAEEFRLIDDEWSAPLVVPFGDAARYVDDLRRQGPSRQRFRALQRYLVNVPRRQLAGWTASGDVAEVEGVAVLGAHAAGAYDDRFGLVPERIGVSNPATLIIDG